MSIKILLDSLSEDKKQLIADSLEFKTKSSFYSQKYGQDDTKIIYAFDIRDDHIHIPFYFANKVLKLPRRSRIQFNEFKLKFSGKLRPLQKTIQKEAIKLLNKSGACIVSLYTGGGKTVVAINTAVKIKLPTLIIATRLIIIDQWEASIKKFCPNARIQKIKTKKKIKKDMDFYIINAINLPKFKSEDFDMIGTMIADEMHLLGTEKLSTAFHYVHPRYVIGLSATPTRPDGMDKLLHAYFGEKQVFRELNREHIAYKVETCKFINVELDIKMTNSGVLDWNALLNSQANSLPRNKLIVKIIKQFPDKFFLVLCKRISHVESLKQLLTNENIECTSLVGIKKTFDTESKVLIATVQKAGVGFDHPKLNALIIAADVLEYFIQYLGRVFRTQYGKPIIFDLVDNFSTFKKHFLSRASVYRKHGGKIKNFKNEFKDF